MLSQFVESESAFFLLQLYQQNTHEYIKNSYIHSDISVWPIMRPSSEMQNTVEEYIKVQITEASEPIRAYKTTI